MKKIFALLLIILFAGYNYLFAQKNKSYSLRSQLGISIPAIWNNSRATYYTLGNPQHPSGNAMSYGVNINWSNIIYRNLFGVIGIGYFKQAFNIKRPFDYTAPDSTKPLVYTKNYAYYNIHWLVGIGYKKAITKNIAFDAIISYNSYHSYKQRYTQQYFPGTNEVYKKSLSIGNMINLTGEVETSITNRISVGGSIILPVYTKWNDDEKFINNFYTDDEQQIGRNKFSIGGAVSYYYRF